VPLRSLLAPCWGWCSRSQVQPCLSSSFGDSSHATRVLVTTTVENDGVDAGGLCTLGDELADLLGLGGLVTVEAPAGITLTVEGNNKLTVAGIDKQAVGETAANIRKIKKPEPYKGKGIRYAGEVVRRKAGKAGK
jgi:hypothetical protein